MASNGSSDDTPKKTCMSEPIKRKKRTQRISSSSDEGEDDYHLVMFEKNGSYSIVEDKNVKFVSNEAGESRVRVCHLGKWYDAKLLKTGALEYIQHKAKKYGNGLSIDTQHEEETNKRLKQMEDEWASKHSPVKTSTTAKATTSAKAFSCSSSSKATSSKKTSSQRKSLGGEKNTTSLTSSLATQETHSMEIDESDNEAENYIIALARERLARAALQREVNEMREIMESLRVDLGQVKENHAEASNRVEYQGKDLVRDFHGKNLVRYALELVEHMFTPEEIIDNVLEDSNKTMRGTLDHQRVKLIKDAVTIKYGLKGEKMDKAWSQIKSAVNQKGRNLKFKLSVKYFLSKNFKRNGNDDQNGNGKNGDDHGSTGGQGMAAAAA